MCSAPAAPSPPSSPRPHLTKLTIVNIHVRNGLGRVGIEGSVLELKVTTWRCRGARSVGLLSVAPMLERWNYRTVGALSHQERDLRFEFCSPDILYICTAQLSEILTICLLLPGDCSATQERQFHLLHPVHCNSIIKIRTNNCVNSLVL
jgi:hypothetical protein